MNLLTICIPTYNRSGFLDKALGALMPQVAAFADKGVRAYVSSNCSTDNTDEVAKKYLDRYSGLIEYVRQPKMNPQHFKVVAQSVRSKYIALMGDDDFIMPGYMDRILKCIEEHPEVGLINYNIINYRDNKYLDIRDPMFCAGWDKFYPCGGEFIKEHHHIPSLMSSNVFVLEDYLKAQTTFDDDDYPGYEWYMALLKSVIHKPCYYIDTPLAWANSPEHVRWEASALSAIILGLCHLFADLDSEYPGIQEAWKSEFENGWMGRASLNLALRYQDEYRCKFDELKQYISPEYAALLHKYLFCSPCWLKCVSLYSRLWKFLRRLIHI